MTASWHSSKSEEVSWATVTLSGDCQAEAGGEPTR